MSTNMNDIKYCEDCKHSRPHDKDRGHNYLLCLHPDVAGVALFVSRVPNASTMEPCYSVRSNGLKCGKSAIYFEQKPQEPAAPTATPRKWWQFWL